ncbi:hypothetical protein [Microcoleus sp. CAWBG50]|nr:hypothetical protein [Microcoleus sp. CAWBG50]
MILMSPEADIVCVDAVSNRRGFEMILMSPEAEMVCVDAVSNRRGFEW